MKLPTYPARPINGGPLPDALPKSGRWIYEPKVNGWRVLVHTPTGTMFNRHGEALSIADTFKSVLEPLKSIVTTCPDFEWLDCEAFERRHPLGRGSLILLDLPLAAGTYEERQFQIYSLHDMSACTSWPHENMKPPENRLLSFAYSYETAGDDMDPSLAWHCLQVLNKKYQCELFEGLVAKRADSHYPIQLRSAGQEFPFWMKHRWAF